MTPLIIRLREWRERRGLTQAELAKLARVRQPTISDLETGLSKAIRFEVLDRLAEALRVTPGELLEREPKAKRAR